MISNVRWKLKFIKDNNLSLPLAIFFQNNIMCYCTWLEDMPFVNSSRNLNKKKKKYQLYNVMNKAHADNPPPYLNFFYQKTITGMIINNMMRHKQNKNVFHSFYIFHPYCILWFLIFQPLFKHIN